MEQIAKETKKTKPNDMNRLPLVKFVTGNVRFVDFGTLS